MKYVSSDSIPELFNPVSYAYKPLWKSVVSTELSNSWIFPFLLFLDFISHWYMKPHAPPPPPPTPFTLSCKTRLFYLTGCKENGKATFCKEQVLWIFLLLLPSFLLHKFNRWEKNGIQGWELHRRGQSHCIFNQTFRIIDFLIPFLFTEKINENMPYTQYKA